MATYKMTMLLELATNVGGASEGHRLAGWSEGVYAISTDFAAARASFQNLCQKRAALLGTGGSVVGQRYQLIDPTGRTQTEARIYKGSTLLTDAPQVALTFTVPAKNSPNVRRFTLRGAVDSIVVEGEYQPGPNTPAKLNAFVFALSGFRFRASNLQAPIVPIGSIAADGTFVLQQPLTYAVNDYLNVSRARNAQQQSFSGRFHVGIRTDAQNGKFSNWFNGATLGGTAQPDTTIYPEFDVAPNPTPKVVVRKVGRPFGGYRGRASTRA